jgi:hypothetical protein
MIFYFYRHVIVSVLHHSYTIIPKSKKNYILVVLESKKKNIYTRENYLKKFMYGEFGSRRTIHSTKKIKLAK